MPEGLIKHLEVQYKMEYEELEKLSLEESKRQTKERREEGLNMIRPFTFDEKKILWDGLYKLKKKNLKEILIQDYNVAPDKFVPGRI